MVTEELDKILDDQSGGTPSDGGNGNDNQTPPEKKPEVQVPSEEEKKQQQLANLNKAIKEGNDELNRIRSEAKKAKTGEVTPPKDGAAPDPQIDFNDPGSKAWDKHIKETVTPVANELDAEKQEVFKFTLKDFLNGKPALATNKDGLLKVINTYERIKDNTGRTKEGVMNDLQRAYAAEFHEEIAQDNSRRRVERARQDALYGDAGVSRGAGNYMEEREADPVYSDADRAILAKWNMSPQEHAQMMKDQKKKKATQ